MRLVKTHIPAEPKHLLLSPDYDHPKKEQRNKTLQKLYKQNARRQFTFYKPAIKDSFMLSGLCFIVSMIVFH